MDSSSPFLSLDDLQPGQKGIIVHVAVAEPLRRRLFDLGLVPGTPVQALGRSFLGDPLAFALRQTVIALRRTDARRILTRPSARA
ncbi:MAG: ferrous iron transport protein A [Clostridia bacterium]|nr:ferrous iron transport protein A [Clostridia bacterium]